MRDYGRIAPTYWTRGSGKKLRGKKDAQILASYLMTSPHATMIGVYYLPLVNIVHETGLTPDEVRAALVVLADPEIDIAHYDEEAELVWLPAMAEHQIGRELKAGDRRRGAPIQKMVMQVGPHRFTFAFWDRYGVAYGLEACPFRAPFRPSPQPTTAIEPPHPEAPSIPLPQTDKPLASAPSGSRSGTGSGTGVRAPERAPSVREFSSGDRHDAAETYQEAVRELTPEGVWGFGTRGERDVVANAVQTYAPPASTADERRAWIRDKVAAWAKSSPSAAVGFKPLKFIDWLRDPRPPDAKFGRQEAPVIRPPPELTKKQIAERQQWERERLKPEDMKNVDVDAIFAPKAVSR